MDKEKAKMYKRILVAPVLLAVLAFAVPVQTQQSHQTKPQGESTMKNMFKAKRAVRRSTQKLIVPPAKVFPLLCPVLEYDWIDGWDCEMVYTDCGVIENNCIFKTHFPGEGEETWVTSRYEPENFRLEFVRVASDFKAIKYDIQLHDCGDGTTFAVWTQTVTALSERGNEFIDGFTEEKYRTLIQNIEKMLNHYFQTGEKLDKEALSK
jgi:hypothetical protein